MSESKLRSIRCRRSFALALVFLVATTLGGSSATADAMTNGWRVSAPPWMALVVSARSDVLCSGTLVAEGWVLTAAHCVVANGSTLSAQEFEAILGRDTIRSPGGGDYAGSRIVVMPGYQSGSKNDAALIQLSGFEASRWHAMPISTESAVTDLPGGMTFFGYGATRFSAAGVSVGSGTLWKSPDGAYVRDTSCDGRVVNGSRIVGSCFRRTSSARLMHGDSGGPALRWVAGAWQLIGVADMVADLRAGGKADPVGATSSLATTTDGRTLWQWVHDTTSIPSVSAGTVLRDPQTGNSWLVADDGYRNWIPTGGDYQCFVGHGHLVDNLPQVVIDTFPDRVGVHATCTPSTAPPPPAVAPTPTPTPTPTPQAPAVRLTQGPPAPFGYRYAVTISGFAPGATVAVNCRDSVSPNGFYTFSLTTDASGRGETASQCYSADGPDHWVVVDSRYESNRVQWVGIVSAPPPPATPSEPTLYAEQETYHHPVNTFTNYHNASGMGTPVAAGQVVQVSCKVRDTTIPSVNPDGYWYRIASSPWNNAYYAPANTFLNGDPAGGPYSRNTDFSVPDC